MYLIITYLFIFVISKRHLLCFDGLIKMTEKEKRLVSITDIIYLCICSEKWGEKQTTTENRWSALNVQKCTRESIKMYALVEWDRNRFDRKYSGKRIGNSHQKQI